MTIWCDLCGHEATHMVEETGQPLCGPCAVAYQKGQAHPDASVERLREFEVTEYANETRELTYRVLAISPDRAREVVEEGLASPVSNEPATDDASGFKHVEFKNVKEL